MYFSLSTFTIFICKSIVEHSSLGLIMSIISQWNKGLVSFHFLLIKDFYVFICNFLFCLTDFERYHRQQHQHLQIPSIRWWWVWKWTCWIKGKHIFCKIPPFVTGLTLLHFFTTLLPILSGFRIFSLFYLNFFYRRTFNDLSFFWEK